MTQSQKARLCIEWIWYCQAIGWSGRATLGRLVDIFWQHKGWETFKGYKPHY